MESHSARSPLVKESGRNRFAKSKWFLLAAIALITLPSTRLVNAQGLLYTVNTTSDTVVVGACQNGDAGCSLRGAIQTANSHAGDDGIEFNLPAGSVINLTGALPDITEGLSITGPGPAKLTVRRDTGGNYRIFTVTATGAVTFSGLTIRDGLFSGSGGGIYNNSTGTVNITNCRLAQNRATASGVSASGGGIYNESGTVNVIGSTLEFNRANLPDGNASGGGIFNASGIVNVSNCALRSNDVGPVSGQNFSINASGGGIFNGSGTVNVTNSTLSTNDTFAIGAGSARGGAIFSDSGTVNVTNSTVSNNISTGFPSPMMFGGGIFNAAGIVKVKSTIIALNRVTAQTGDEGSNPDVSGPFTSQGFNLIGKRDGSTGFSQPTDQTGTVASPLDPKLDSVARDNGGPTSTIALLSGSPAIDKGSSAGLTGNLTTDQRGTGFRRTFNYPSVINATGGDGTDIGAYELLVPFSVSRKTHGATPFDILNPLFGAAGVECRTGGATGDFRLIVTFPSPVTVNGNPQAQVTLGTGTVGSGGVSNGGVVTINGAEVTVPLTNVDNAQTILVTLFAANDGTGPHNVNIAFSFLLGDTTGNGTVNSSDIGQTKSKSGQTVSATNFRTDVTVSGSINSSDIGLVKSKSGTALP